MKSTQKRHVVRTSVVAVHCALVTMVAVPVAQAEVSEDVLELTQPTNTIEIGIGNVDKGSRKFGEYNGLENKGTFVNGGFELSGGAGYDVEGDGTVRWRVEGTDLGLESRSLNAEYADQGKFRIKFGFDQTPRNQYDGYMTPYAGGGTQALTLPGYPTLRGATAPTATSSGTAITQGPLANWGNLQSPYATGAGTTASPYAGSGPGVLLPAMMRNFNVDTLRTRETFDLALELSPRWQFKFNVRHEDKEGTKLTGVAPGNRIGALVPEPIDTTTDQFRATLNFVDDKSNLSLGYYGSIFRNKVNSWTMANPFNSNLLDRVFNDSARLVGAPDNEMHRFNLAGAYNFSKTTRLMLSGYYQRMTQNEQFQGPFPVDYVLPGNSINGLVLNKHFNATLTSRPLKDLSVLASYKYEDRDNQTPSRTYTTRWADSAAAGNINTFTNEPLRRTTHQVNLEGDYRFAPRQAIKAGYEYQQIERKASLDAAQALLDQNAAAFARVGLDAQAELPWKTEESKEHTLKLEYRNNLSERVTGNLGYNYAQRRAHYEDNPSLATPPINPPRLPAATVYFPAGEPLLPGFRQYFLADRNRDKVRGSVNFQATDALALQAGVDYNKDDYSNSPYGLKNSDSWVLNLDGTLTASENLSFNAYFSHEDKKSQLDSLAVTRATRASDTANVTFPHASGNCATFTTPTGRFPDDFGSDPCRNWSESQTDRVDTIGLGVKASGLMSGKFDFSGDVAYSRARTPISMTGGSYASNGLATLNTVFVPATSFPDITSEMIEVRLSGKYTLDKTSAIRVNYLYRNLKSNDWQWDAYLSTPGTNLSSAVTMPGMVGTNLASPNYTVNVVSVYYIYSFR